MPRADATATRIVRKIGRVVREARISAGLTQEEAAAKARLDYKHWQELEGGRVDVRVSTLVKVARALGIPVAELVTLTRGRPPKRRSLPPRTVTEAPVPNPPAKRKRAKEA